MQARNVRGTKTSAHAVWFDGQKSVPRMIVVVRAEIVEVNRKCKRPLRRMAAALRLLVFFCPGKLAFHQLRPFGVGGFIGIFPADAADARSSGPRLRQLLG